MEVVRINTDPQGLMEAVKNNTHHLGNPDNREFCGGCFEKD